MKNYKVSPIRKIEHKNLDPYRRNKFPYYKKREILTVEENIRRNYLKPGEKIVANSIKIAQDGINFSRSWLIRK